tara:strand:+ start:596 stop:904 length:309 start_codon:yes stop_codon:yes gene_type:complete
MLDLNKEIILKSLEENKDGISKFGVKKLILFGSFAKDVQKADSDIDIIVEFKEERGLFDDFYGLTHFLEGIFGRKIELVEKTLIREELKSEILGGPQFEAKV